MSSFVPIYAVDFDGTLCESKWPGIGAPNKKLIQHLVQRRTAELPVVVEEVNAFHGYISVRSTSEEDKFRYFKIRRDIEWFYDKLFPKE